jgi:predicted lipoprotein
MRTTQLCIAAFAGAITFVAVLACPQTRVDHRPEVIANTATRIDQDLEQAHMRAELLGGAVDRLCVDLDAASLDAAQAAWSDLRGPWKRLLAVQLEPIADGGYESALDFWPARTSSIEGGILLGAQTQADIDALGVASKGMPAIEYLLWDPVAGDAAILALLQAPERCDYLQLLADDVEHGIIELETAWRDELAPQWTGAGDSELYPTLALAIDDLVNAMIAGLHDIDDMKLGKPIGETVAQPDLVESRFSDRSLLDASDALTGFSNAYLGSEDAPGLTLVIAERSEDVDARVREAIDAATAALAAVPESLRTTVVESPTPAIEARAAVHELRTIMTAEVAALLGVTVSLSDNDGD